MTLEPDVANDLKKRVEARKQPMKRVVNDLLRAALKLPEKKKPFEFKVTPIRMAIPPGVRPTDYLAELEYQDYLEKQLVRLAALKAPQK